MLVVALGGASVLALAACGLVSGLGDLSVCTATDCVDAGVDAVAVDGVAADVVVDVAPDRAPQTCGADSGACTGALAAGWTPVAFAASPTEVCPSNFIASELVFNPLAQVGACACSCNLTTQPACGLGAVSLAYGNSIGCGSGNLNYNVSVDGQCTDFGAGTFTEVAFHKWSKPSLTPGTCAGGPVADGKKVSTTAARACVPPPTCAEDVCNGAVPSGFKSCVIHDGDVACPSGPFTAKSVTGTSTSLACAPCGACVVGGQCGVATVRSYGDSACTVLKDTDVADGNCNATLGAGGINHFTYVAPVQNVTCTAGISSSAVDLVGKRTVCCR